MAEILLPSLQSAERGLRASVKERGQMTVSRGAISVRQWPAQPSWWHLLSMLSQRKRTPGLLLFMDMMENVTDHVSFAHHNDWSTVELTHNEWSCSIQEQ